MEWFQANLVELLAIVGALYSIARIVVALTPTPKDDAALAEVSALVRMIARAVGLDLKQGVQKGDDSDPPRNVGPGLSLLLAITLWTLVQTSGCVTVDARANLVASQKVFAGTVRVLSTAIQAGEFSDDDLDQITLLVHGGEQLLADWEAAVRAGADDTSFVSVFNQTIDRLLAYEAQTRKDE